MWTLLIPFLFYAFNVNSNQIALATPAESITIFGNCHDVSTGINLKVKATVFLKESRVSLGESNKSGKFEFQIPDSTKFLLFEAKGYHSATIPVNILGKIDKQVRFKVSVSMIAKDSQQINMVQKVSEKQGKSQTVSGKTAVFEVKDAHNNKVINAKVCLTFTKTRSVKCLETDSLKVPASILLDQNDKVAFIVSSNGYQDYIGNLINDTAGNQEEFYQIKLLRSVHPLSLHYDVPKGLKVNFEIAQNGSLKTSYGFIGGASSIDYLEVIKPGNYQLTASTSDGNVLLKKNINTSPGFNFKSIHLEKPVSRTVVVKKTVVPVTVNLSDKKVLFFDQSKYILRDESKSALDSISTYLTRNPKLSVHVTGHSDNVGKRDLNLLLAEHRARVVAHYLKENGVESSRISLKWLGPDLPVNSNDTEENKVKNRRVEIQFITK